MSKFHSTVSRRDFMKGLGLAGAGLGAAAATTPVFHDLDELSSSTSTHTQHPWWVKERDFEDITTPVDWNIFKAYNPITNPVPRGDSTARSAIVNDEYVSGITNNTPNLQHRDFALEAANRPYFGGLTVPFAGTPTTLRRPVPPGPYQGTADENLHMLRAAFRQLGASTVGAFELNDHMKRTFDEGFVHFEDIDVGFEDTAMLPTMMGPTTIKHVPNKCNSVVTWTIAQSFMLGLHGHGSADTASGCMPLFNAGVMQAYGHVGIVAEKAMIFIKALGYQAYRFPFFKGVSSNVPHGVFTGLSEQGRHAYGLSPSHGSMFRLTDHIITDLPITPTKPIDAGLTEFCKTCAICADNCPSGAITTAKELSWEVADGANRPGHNGWHMDWVKCNGWGGPGLCGRCQVVCPMNHPPDSSVHSLVRGTIANTSIFNGFFTSMEGFMGYGKMKDGNEWWDRDLKTWKYDTIYGIGSAHW